jgi:hypothetical protein
MSQATQDRPSAAGHEPPSAARSVAAIHIRSSAEARNRTQKSANAKGEVDAA